MDGHQRLHQIEQAAGRLFAERTYAGTSVRDIARELDLQGGSLYAHISSKEEVLWRIVERAGREFHDAVSSIAAGTGSAVDRLHRMIRGHVGVITTDPRLATVFLHEWKHLEGGWREKVLGMRDAYEGYFRDVISEGMDESEIASGDAALSTRFLLSALNGIALWYQTGGQLAPDELADACWSLFQSGMLLSSASAPNGH